MARADGESKIQNKQSAKGGQQEGIGCRQSKAEKEIKGEDILRDFVWTNKDLVDEKVYDEFVAGNKQTVTEALNQIHWRSLKLKGGLDWKERRKIPLLGCSEKDAKVKTYAEAVSSHRNQKITTLGNDGQLGKSFDSPDGDEWTVVRNRKTKNKNVNTKRDLYTIFLYNILVQASAKDIWYCLKNTVEIVDIILPRKRDKRNKRFGFVKTTSELEAGKIILNAK